ncbi:jg12388 [Pararge aegeria aegeria]|uniref:Jg12388 protein n=1 Tax=Pararge aegeria aegeria TaxID=348720 RepID=A0A8S4S6Y9_9NEOP|nr:jg12388 [Pararge aegeria aegeria]
MSDFEKATEAASLAVSFDQVGDVDKAVECYRTSAYHLGKVCDNLLQTPQRQAALREKIEEYQNRANTLQEQKAQRERSNDEAEYCYKLISQALAADEANYEKLAFQIYTHAVEEAVISKSIEPGVKSKLNSVALKALERAEELKDKLKLAPLSVSDSKLPAIVLPLPIERDIRSESDPLTVTGKQDYSEEEKEVLRLTSNINNNCFLPFMDIDLKENFHYPLPFEDRASELKLSSKQQREFDRWVRPHEVCINPKLIVGDYVDCFSIKQTNIDLHALTGWIPERCSIREGEADFNADALFETILIKLARGLLLATVATGPLEDAEAERTGLVASHAYAVLDVRFFNGAKLLKLKNPWSHVRWRGNYSELDTVHWTPELREKLSYDPDTAAQHDNGVFWIDYASILKFFDVFYLNWNPDQFHGTYCIHQKWDAGNGPVKDAYNIGENPQFTLHLRDQGEVWLLLTRHITDLDDFRDNKEYITLRVYKGGNRIYYPYESENNYSSMQLHGAWSGKSAGGCENNRETYANNPKFAVKVPVSRYPCHLVVLLKGPKEYQMGLDCRIESLDDPNVTAPFHKATSGPYRSGFVVIELPNLPAGKYVVSPSTFYPAQEGPFFLELKATFVINCEVR